MGLFDRFKEATEAAAYVASKPVTFAKHAAKPVTAPAGWAWGKTIGELGDRDYTPVTDAATNRAAQVQAEQQETLFGGAVEPKGPGPLGQAALEWAAQRGVDPRPQGNSLTDIVTEARDNDNPLAWRMAAHARGYDVGNSLSPMVWERQMQERQQEQAQAEVVNRLETDWDRLFGEDADLDEIEDWKMLGTSVVQMMENAKDDEGNIIDEEMWLGGQSLLNQHYERIAPHIEIVAPGWWDENFEFYEGPSAFARKASGLAAPVLEAFQKVARHQFTGLENIIGTVQGDEIDWTDRGFKGDHGGDGGFRERILGDEDAGGEWGRILDLAVEIGIDPLSYVTAGQSATVKATLQSTAKQALKEGGEAALKRHATYWQIIKEQGFKGLDELGQAEVEKWIRKDAVEIAARQGGGKSKVQKLLAKQHDKIAKLDQKIEKVYERNLERVQRGGREGLHAGGRTILPSHRLLPGLKSRGVFEDVTELHDLGRTQDVRRPGDPIFERQTRIVPGEVVGDVVDEAADPRIQRLRDKAEGTSFPSEADAFMKKADDLADKLRDGLAPSQDIRYIDEMIQTGQEWIDEVIPLLDPVVRKQITQINPGLARKIAGSIPGLRARFIPRGKLIGSIGKSHSGAVREMIVEAQGLANEKSIRVKDRLTGPLGKAARKELGVDEEGLIRFLNEAMADADAMVAARVTGGKKTNEILDALQEIREDVWRTLDDDQKELFGNRESYIPRVLSEKGRKFLNDLSNEDLARLEENGAKDLIKMVQAMRAENAQTLKQKSLKDSFTEARTIEREIQDLTKLNAKLRKFFDDAGIQKAEDLFENDILAAWAVRADSAYKAKMINDIIDGMASLGDQAGDVIAVPVREWHNYTGGNRFQLTKQHEFGDYYLHEDLIRPLEELNQVLYDPARMDKLGKVTESFQSLWARYATLSPGFHTRNMLGNVFNAFLGGLTNPIRYVQAARLQRAQHAIRQRMRETGVSFDQAARELGVSRADNLLIQDMQRHRIASGTVGDVFKERSFEKFGPKEILDPHSQSALNPTTWSRNIGTMVEHNARMALYIDAIEKGMAPMQAAAHVKEFLFDYDDLTSFEQGIRRNLSRFYTFMRKNTALQANVLVKAPGRIANSQRILESATNWIFGDPDDEEGLLQLPKWAQVAGMKIRGGNAVGFESPFVSAANTVEDLMALPLAIAEISGVPLEHMPDTMQSALLYNNVQERFGQALGLFSGLPKAGADLLYGQATGYDPFTGAIVGYDNPRNTDKMGLVDLIGVVNPFVGRWERWAEDKEKIEAGEQDLGLTLWNIFGGAMVYENDRIHNSAVNTIQRDIKNYLDQMGDDRLSIQDLRKMGRIDTVNRFMHIMAYGGIGVPEEERDGEIMRSLAGIVPKEILEYYVNRGQLSQQLVDEREYSTEMRPQDDMERAIRALPEVKAALETLLERPLNRQEEINLILTSDMAPWMSELEAYGLEGFRDFADPERNIFTKDQFEDERDDRVKSTINALGASFGIDFDAMLALRPRLTEVERVVEQARLAGESEEAVFQYLIEESSRLDINVMFGEDALSEFAWMGFDDRDAAREQNAAVEDRMKFIYLYEYVNKRPPTQAEINLAVAHMNIGRTDQKILIKGGLLPSLGPYPPSRTNLQSDREQAQDAVREFGAVMQGAEGHRFMGLYPEADERKSIQLGGSDRIYGPDRFAEAPNFTRTG